MIISLCGCMMQEPLVVEKLKKSYHFVNLISEPTISTASLNTLSVV